MSILKNLTEIFKIPFKDNSLLCAFAKSINPPRNYQKEMAENLKKIKEEITK